MANKKEDVIEDIDELTECLIKLDHMQRATYDLYEAIANNDFDAAQEAINNGADANAPRQPCTTSNDTPLDCAVYWTDTYDCSTKMIEFLKKRGATNYNQETVKFLEDAEKCLVDKTLRKRKFKK